MENSARSVIEQKLSSGERLVWSGQPRGGIRLRGYDAFVIPFSVVWCGIAIAIGMTPNTRRATPPDTFPIFVLPFVLVGAYLILGRFIIDAKMRRGTFYGVTNERIIMISGLFGRHTKSINLRTLTDLSLTERSDGSGTITFGPVHPYAHWFAPSTLPSAIHNPSPNFDLIDHAKEVYEMIRQAQKAAT